MSISNSLLNWCRKLKQILEDSNVALMGKGLNKVDNLFQIPAEIEKIGEINRLPYLFRDEIIEVSAEELGNITKIKCNAFAERESIISVEIPNGVTIIESRAFFQCFNLTSVTIPNSVTTIGEIAFDQCFKLKDIYLTQTAPPSLGSRYSMCFSTTIHVPIGSKESYDNATNWSYHSARIVDDIVID